MITFLNYVRQYSLEYKQLIPVDNNGALPLRLAIRQLWINQGLESPSFQKNGSQDRLNGNDLRNVLLSLGVDSTLDPRLGWIGSYPSLILSIALTDPIGLLNGYPKNEDPTHIRQNSGSIAWLLEDSLKFSDNKESMILSHDGLGSIVHKVYPFPRSGKVKKIEIKEENKADPVPYEKRFTGISKRFKVAGSPLHPDSVHPYLRDQGQDRFLLCFTTQAYPVQGQLNILVNPARSFVGDKGDQLIGSLEYRSVNRITGSRLVRIIGDLIATTKGKFKITFNNRINEIIDPLDCKNLGKLFPLIGINQKTIKPDNYYTLSNIYESSQLLENSTWNKVGLNVSITKENNPIFIGKEKNTEKRRNRDIQSAPPIHWDPIGKSDPDPIKGANLPRSVAFPYDR